VRTGMEIARKIASGAVTAILSPLAGHDPLLSLLPLSILLAIGMLLIFRRVSNPQAIAKMKGRLMAHLYEMRLFTDEPALIWKAQTGLLTANVRYIGLMLAPVLVLSIPMILVLSQLECFYGHAPLAPQREAIVTVQLKNPAPGPAPVLQAPQGIAVETEGVRVNRGRQVSWRIRAERPVTGRLRIVFPDQTVEKSVDAGAGPRYVSDRRVSSLADLIWHPAESLLPPGRVDWVEIRYPEATIQALGMELHWLVWVFLFSMIAALLLKRRFGVVF
jgi:hypothetical protein